MIEIIKISFAFILSIFIIMCIVLLIKNIINSFGYDVVLIKRQRGKSTIFNDFKID